MHLSIRQFVEAWRVLSTAAPSRSVDSAEGIEYVFSGTPLAFFNAAILTGSAISADALEAYARGACEWAASREVPWLLVVTDAAVQPGVHSAAVLDRCGFVPLMPLTGMVAADVASVSRVPAGLGLVVPHDDHGCEAVLDVNSAAYGMSLDSGKHAWGRQAFWKNHYAVLGLAGGQPVSSATVLMVDGYRYVALVATAPGHQRRGYADAAMRHALELARRANGECPTFLHATDAGRPVYERMGYETVSQHTIFIRKQFLER
jgi:GNAT superfamily N-acetyltransferase